MIVAAAILVDVLVVCLGWRLVAHHRLRRRATIEHRTGTAEPLVHTARAEDAVPAGQTERDVAIGLSPVAAGLGVPQERWREAAASRGGQPFAPASPRVATPVTTETVVTVEAAPDARAIATTAAGIPQPASAREAGPRVMPAHDPHGDGGGERDRGCGTVAVAGLAVAHGAEVVPAAPTPASAPTGPRLPVRATSRLPSLLGDRWAALHDSPGAWVARQILGDDDLAPGRPTDPPSPFDHRRSGDEVAPADGRPPDEPGAPGDKAAGDEAMGDKVAGDKAAGDKVAAGGQRGTGAGRFDSAGADRVAGADAEPAFA